jgi:glycosyltransferase involved in cell wall biosynthesis
MHYALIDDSVPFDSFTSGRRPLGGAEKGFARLAVALAKRHSVTVLNRTPYAVTGEGVDYRPLSDLQHRPLEADVVIAGRQPHLLGAVRKARHRLLWVTAAPGYLDAPANADLWASFMPTILFISAAQQRQYRGPLPHKLLAPGVSSTFFPREPSPETGGEAWAPTAPSLERQAPHAVITTHPLHGLIWLAEIWRRLIHPQMPEARCAVYSTTLAKGMRGEEVAPELQPVVERVREASAANMIVTDPLGDIGMADVYRAARVHLYPGHPQDFGCWTLAESQAAGVPAVARAVGGVEEQVMNGQSGFLVPDASAIANVTLQILQNNDVCNSLSAAACDVARRRTWDMVALELEEIVANLPPQKET